MRTMVSEKTENREELSRVDRRVSQPTPLMAKFENFCVDGS